MRDEAFLRCPSSRAFPDSCDPVITEEVIAKQKLQSRTGKGNDHCLHVRGINL